MTTSSPESPASATVDESLRLGTGFAAKERSTIVDRLGALDARLRSFSASTVQLELSVKDREGADQKTTLEAWVAGQERVVATSTDPTVDSAVVEVRDQVIRQLTDAKNKTEPRQNRMLRVTKP